MEFAYFCCLQQSRVRIWTVIYLFSLRQIQDRNRDSQLSLLLPFKWGLYSSDASSVSDVRDASNASKVSDAIHVSDFSNAKSNIFSNISDVINVMTSVSIVMLVNLAMLSAQVKV